MKKIIAISFLFIYAFSTTELAQLVKLPLLIEHYQEHKKENNDITLLQFLAIHYTHGNVKDADYDKDMQLPFKTHDGCINASIAAFVPFNFSTSVEKPCTTENKSYPTLKDKFLANSFLSNIWQPPRA